MTSVRVGVVGAWPAGVKTDNEGRGEWIVRFNENPWSTRGGQSTVYASVRAHGYAYLRI
jgi:hypothetical protein